MVLILLGPLMDILEGRRATGGNVSRGGDGGDKKRYKVGATRGARVRVQYNAHIPTLLFRDGNNSWTLLAGTVLPTLHGYVFCKNWHLCGPCWEECECKTRTPPPPPRGGNHHLRAAHSGLGGMICVPEA